MFVDGYIVNQKSSPAFEVERTQSPTQEMSEQQYRVFKRHTKKYEYIWKKF